MKKLILKPKEINIGNLILVNAQYPYIEDKESIELIPVLPNDKAILLTAPAVRVLTSVMDKINGWECISAISGWRSRKEQEELYADSLRDNGKEYTEKYVALPGHSEHETGLAIDLGLTQENIDFICPEFPYKGICQKFREVALTYGFIQRYPVGKEAITGIAHEPWHFRYVGAPHAQIMNDLGLTLEEYIGFLSGREYAHDPYVYVNKGIKVQISYVTAQEGKDTIIEINDNKPYAVSGNNINGFIITEWGV